MTTETAKPDGEQQAAESQKVETPQTLEEALAIINYLKGVKSEAFSERDKLKGKLKAFEYEQTQREQSALTEQGKYKELYEKAEAEKVALKTGLKNKAVDAALLDVIQKAGARAVDTVAKLIDKSKVDVNGDDFTVDITTIQSQIEELKKTDPILFGVSENVNSPPVKRPTDGVPQTGYQQEMRAAKTQEQINAVIKKYGFNR
jgi:hypothetical protein